MLKIAAIAVVVALAIAGAILLLGGDDDDGEPVATGPPGDEFTLVRPDGWTEVRAEERELIPGRPLLVMQRGEGEGLVTVNAPARRAQDLDKVASQLDKRLKKAIPDFRKVAARVVTVKAGDALLYSYARTKRGTANTLLVVPAGDRTYTVSAVVPAGAEDAARDVGVILNSFDV